MKAKPLIEYFNRLLPLDEDEQSIVELVFKERRIKKRHFILQEGDVSKFNTFVLEGCFKMYMVDINGKQHNLQFKEGKVSYRVAVNFFADAVAHNIIRGIAPPSLTAHESGS